MTTELSPMLEACLKDWRSVTQTSSMLTEEQLEQMLEHERNNQRRRNILVRLHQAYTRLRTTRERQELMEISNEPR